LLDPGVLLSACGGDAALLEKMIRSLRAHLPGHLAEVRTALARGSAAQLRQAAHKFGGLVSAFSPAAAEMAQALEKKGVANALDGAEPILAALIETMERLGPCLERLSVEELQRRAKGP
jgi:HPt (histidine-containing phosphotransfer) domain-containing protein